MTVSFVDVFENNKEVSLEEINYIIPYSGKLVIKDVEPDSCVLNHKLIHHDSIFELPVKQDDIILSCGSDNIRIKILKGELSQESIIDYQDIYKQYLSFTNDGCFDGQDLLKISEYNGEKYLDNFYTYIDKIDIVEALLFIISMIGRALFNLFSHFTIKHFTSSHVVFLLIMGEISLDWGEKSLSEVIITIFIFVVELTILDLFDSFISVDVI